jgi:hypothetical protein
MDDLYLLDRAKTTGKLDDPGKFFFYLGLLLGNPEWDALKFNLEGDYFTHNLQLIPTAFETMIFLSSQLFDCGDDQINAQISKFFTGAEAVAHLKKEGRGDLYAPFVVLMDHFPSLSKRILYGHMKEAFPFTLIRACYNQLADPVQ